MRPPAALVAQLVLLCLCTRDAGAAAEPFALRRILFDSNVTAQARSQQGYSVAIDGDPVVVGAPQDDVGAYTAGVAKVYDANTGTLLHTLTNPSPAASEHFGIAVAVSGSHIVVGADGDRAGTIGARRHCAAARHYVTNR